MTQLAGDSPTSQPDAYGGVRPVIVDNATGNSFAACWAKSIRLPDVLSIVSAYFTMQAFSRMRAQLDDASFMHFLFGDPSHVNAVDSTGPKTRAYEITEKGPALAVQLQ